MKSGVYAIFNKKENKVYVGSSKDIETRINKHRNDLKKKQHHNSALQYDFNEGAIFDFEILSTYKKRELSSVLREHECEFINKFLDEGYYLYNSNISCSGDYPYFMVRPNCLEFVETTDNRLKELEDEIKQLKAIIDAKDQTNRKLIFENCQLIKDHREEISKLNKKYDFNLNDSFINEVDSCKLKIMTGNIKQYQNRAIEKLDDIEDVIFNNYFNLESEIEIHYLNQFKQLSFFDRIFADCSKIEGYRFDKNSFDKYGFLDMRINRVKDWIKAFGDSYGKIECEIKEMSVNYD